MPTNDNNLVSSLDEIIEFLDSLIEDRDTPPEPDTGSEPRGEEDRTAVSSRSAIDYIIEGTLNSYLDNSTFPTLDQAQTLRLLQDLKDSL